MNVAQGEDRKKGEKRGRQRDKRKNETFGESKREERSDDDGLGGAPSNLVGAGTLQRL